MKRLYDAFGLVIADQQEHSGAVSGSTPTVSAQYNNGSGNLLRRTAVTNPGGTRVDFTSGTSGSLEDIFNRAAALKGLTGGQDTDAFENSTRS